MAAVGQWGRRLRQVFLLTAWDRVKPGNPGGKGELGRKVSLTSDMLKVPEVPTRGPWAWEESPSLIPHVYRNCEHRLVLCTWCTKMN